MALSSAPIALLLGSVVLLGWYTRNEALIQISSAPFAALFAMGLVGLGLGGISRGLIGRGPWWRRLALAGLGTSLCFAGLWL